MSTQEILREFDHLDLDAKLRLLDALWQAVAPGDGGAPLTDSDRLALRERLDDVAADPRPARPLASVISDLKGRRSR